MQRSREIMVLILEERLWLLMMAWILHLTHRSILLLTLPPFQETMCAKVSVVTDVDK